jgi:hypothetical protein
LLVLLLLALLFACFLRVGGLGIRLLRIIHVDTPCRIRRLLLQKEQAAFPADADFATAEPSGAHSSCGLRGSPCVIFGAHARGQPRLLVTTPQFVTHTGQKCLRASGELCQARVGPENATAPRSNIA